MTLPLTPGQSRATQDAVGGVEPDASVAKLLAYAACATGIALSATTGQLALAAIACFRLVADDVEKITG
jgi:hypothetical protein